MDPEEVVNVSFFAVMFIAMIVSAVILPYLLNRRIAGPLKKASPDPLMRFRDYRNLVLFGSLFLFSFTYVILFIDGLRLSFMTAALLSALLGIVCFALPGALSARRFYRDHAFP